MNDDFGMLSDDEVLFVRAGRVLMANPTFKVSEFLDALAQLVSEQEDEWTEEQEGWFTDRGARCEMLRFGNQGWQRGRVRIRVEFCPEAPPKLLRESRTPKEDVYQRDDTYQQGEYRQEKSYRRRNREDVYPRDVYPRSEPQWNDEPTIYPEIDEDY